MSNNSFSKEIETKLRTLTDAFNYSEAGSLDCAVRCLKDAEEDSQCQTCSKLSRMINIIKSLLTMIARLCSDLLKARETSRNLQKDLNTKKSEFASLERQLEEEKKSLRMILPDHRDSSLYICHNLHKERTNQSVSEAFDKGFYQRSQFEDYDAINESIRTGEVWTITWKKPGKLGKITVAAPTLADVVRLATSDRN